jgi:hypothetical protein
VTTFSYLFVGASLLVLGAACSVRAPAAEKNVETTRATAEALTAPLDATNFFARKLGAYCAWQARCGFLRGEEEANCEAGVAQHHDYDPGDAAAAGRLAFDPAAAAACITATLSADCALSDVDPEACDRAYVGLVQPGDSCTASRECAGGGQCGQGTEGCAATCVGAVGLGEDCSAAPCGPGTFCLKMSAPVATATCVPRGKIGAPCAGSVPADDCEDGLVCEPTADFSAGTCARPGKEGDRCFYDLLFSGGRPSCADGLVCDSLLDESVCVPLKTRGEACGTDDACAAGLKCVGIIYQLGGGIFQAGACIPPKDIGDACDSDNDCMRLQYCQSSKCTAMTHPGELCWIGSDTGDTCAIGYCSSMSHLCVDRPAIGDHCDTRPGSNPNECPFPASCDVDTNTCKLDCGGSDGGTNLSLTAKPGREPLRRLRRENRF